MTKRGVGVKVVLVQSYVICEWLLIASRVRPHIYYVSTGVGGSIEENMTSMLRRHR